MEGSLLEGRFVPKTLTSPYQAEEMAEVILRRSRDAKELVSMQEQMRTI